MRASRPADKPVQAVEGGSPDFLGGVKLHRGAAAHQASSRQETKGPGPQMAQEMFTSAQQQQGPRKQQAPQRAIEEGMDRDGHFFLESSINCFSFSAFFLEIFLVKQTGEGSGCGRSVLRKMRFLAGFGGRHWFCSP